MKEWRCDRWWQWRRWRGWRWRRLIKTRLTSWNMKFIPEMKWCMQQNYDTKLRPDFMRPTLRPKWRGCVTTKHKNLGHFIKQTQKLITTNSSEQAWLQVTLKQQVYHCTTNCVCRCLLTHSRQFSFSFIHSLNPLKGRDVNWLHLAIQV